MRPPIKLRETGRVRETLTTDEARALTESGLVTVTADAKGQWSIKSRGKVGVARVGDLEVWIEPKLRISRLLFLVSYAQDRVRWRDDLVGLDEQQGLVPAVGEMLWRHTETALRQGFIQGYRPVDEPSHVMRGRLRENAQVRRNHGQIIPMEVRYDDLTPDIPENQILLAAVSRMLEVDGLSATSRLRLAALRTRLAAVASPIRGDTLPSWQPTRLNQRYHTALSLAEIIWKGGSPEYGQGSVVVNGFLFEMENVFEDFVAAAFDEYLCAIGGGDTEAQYPCHLDLANAVTMRLDLIWRRNRQILAVIDAKYKEEKKADRNPQLFQMLAYCAALGVRHGHLIYAKGSATPERHVVRNAGIEIVAHALDLSLPPDELLAQVREICAELVAGTRAA